MDIEWKQFLETEKNTGYYRVLLRKLEKELSEFTIYPKKEDVFRAFELTSFNNIKCVIVGQDPYFNPEEAHGLAFSVKKDNKIPPSLRNIYKELATDININRVHGDLTDWAEQGVFLINRVLTVRKGEPNSHKNIGWMQFTLNTIKKVSESPNPIVFMLWGAGARKLKSVIDKRHLVLEAPHPSPLSSYRGFFGCAHFSKCNSFLEEVKRGSIQWG
ncbi:MAG: uracil-DNA glycosylase [Spirochaetaceae bacterium]